MNKLIISSVLVGVLSVGYLALAEDTIRIMPPPTYVPVLPKKMQTQEQKDQLKQDIKDARTQLKNTAEAIKEDLKKRKEEFNETVKVKREELKDEIKEKRARWEPSAYRRITLSTGSRCV